MVVSVRSLGLSGISGYAVSAECFLSGGLPAFDVVGLPDAAVKQRVDAARAIQSARFAGTATTCNAYMTPAQIQQFCALDTAGDKLMKAAFERMGLSARAYDRVLKVSRTIADLAGSEQSLHFLVNFH